ncbi:MAG: kinase [Novosphingobium sp.]
MVVLGICGAQGSGKSTLADALCRRFSARPAAVPMAVLSLDDLYRTRAERAVLARDVHPLLATRGVPGTHDIGLGLDLLDALDRGEAVRLPRFDKGRDDRTPEAQWPLAGPGVRLLIVEGWCVGATAQQPAELIEPVNPLEACEDADRIWRYHVNAALAGDYQRFFARLDALALLAAPSFEVVVRWRDEAERPLRDGGSPEAMDEPMIRRFVQHYERLTRHILREMPARADLVAWLDDRRRPVRLDR